MNCSNPGKDNEAYKETNMAQSKEQNKSPETNLKEMDILRLPAKELKIFILKKKAQRA